MKLLEEVLSDKHKSNSKVLLKIQRNAVPFLGLQLLFNYSQWAPVNQCWFFSLMPLNSSVMPHVSLWLLGILRSKTMTVTEALLAWCFIRWHKCLKRQDNPFFVVCGWNLHIPEVKPVLAYDDVHLKGACYAAVQFLNYLSKLLIVSCFSPPPHRNSGRASGRKWEDIPAFLLQLDVYPKRGVDHFGWASGFPATPRRCLGKQR